MALALTIGPAPGRDDDLTDEQLRAAWEVFGPKLMQDAGSRLPWGFWAFASEVPAELRGTRPTLYPLEDAERVEAEYDDLQERRAAWLLDGRPRR
jgi:hypothetical protein